MIPLTVASVPISNLSVLSKLLEHLVVSQLLACRPTSATCNLASFQVIPPRPPCCASCRTFCLSTAAISPLWFFWTCRRHSTCTVDYDILLQRLETSFGVTGTALSWFQTYLSGRTQCVSGATRTSAIPLVCGIPRARSCSQSYSYCMSLTLLQLFRSLACLRTSMPTTLRFTARARLTFTLFTLRAS